MFIYPENLKAKPMLWLWELRDIGIIGVGFLLSVLALSQGAGMIPLVITVLFSFLTIRVDGSSILDFLRRAACFLILQQQYYESGLYQNVVQTTFLPMLISILLPKENCTHTVDPWAVHCETPRRTHSNGDFRAEKR